MGCWLHSGKGEKLESGLQMALLSPTGCGLLRYQQSHLLWRLEEEGNPPKGQHSEQSTLCSILPGRREDLNTDGKEVWEESSR